ncbi:MAG: hypothetical protein M1812_002608 [Candelaria pacifica]|nr:MAG: hypothetical protein M1812_002608 [Candelaria pacifica]
MPECTINSLRVTICALSIGTRLCRRAQKHSKTLSKQHYLQKPATQQQRWHATAQPDLSRSVGISSSIVHTGIVPPYHHRDSGEYEGVSSAPKHSGNETHRAKSSRALEQELRYLKDPMKLADHIRYTLRDENPEKSVELVRMASKDMQCTVSWNHIVDFQMTFGRVNAALKTYNEMKKRGQIPDSYTYLLIFRGLASHAHYPQALEKALSIYHSMSSAKSPVRPSIIHTNAVLKVCGRANNTDALWGIAAKLPELGKGAPNNLTWTTILNAVQRSAMVDSESLNTPDEKSRRKGKAVLEGRRMWDDIVGRWRKGNMWIDEELVCAMGRLLLIGEKYEDWDDVLSLVEQTMAVPRGTTRRRDPDREEPSIAQLGNPKGAHPEPDDETLQPGGEFQILPVGQPDSSGKEAPSFKYAVPGKNTLSLVLEACMKMRMKKPATDYWKLMTDGTRYRVQPDLDNFNALMRILRFSRSSGEVLELIRTEMPGAKVQPTKTSFWIAMSTCMRDKNNPNVLDCASQILDLMQNKLADPDVRTIRLYLDLAVATDKGANIVKALHRLGPSLINMRSLLAYGFSGTGQEVDLRTKHELVTLSRTMVGCYDRLLNRGEVPRETYSSYMRERSKIAAFVTRWCGTDKRKREGAGQEGKVDVPNENPVAMPSPLRERNQVPRWEANRRVA